MLVFPRKNQWLTSALKAFRNTALIVTFIATLITFPAVQLALCQNSRGDIRHPILAWQVEQPAKERFAELLAGFCESEPDLYIPNSFKCNVESLGPNFSNILLSGQFFAWGIIMGHFLAPKSEDAVLS